MWHCKLVADGLAFGICCVQTGGFVLLSPGEDRAFLLASRFLSVGATKKNICGMQGRGREKRGRERGGKKLTKRLANTISPKCSVSLPVVRCLQWGKHVNTSHAAHLIPAETRSARFSFCQRL